jgi:hypothetical protein
MCSNCEAIVEACEPTTVITKECPFCFKTNSVKVKLSELTHWHGGMLIQNAFKSLNADQREILQTGICPKCWDETFGE